MEYLLFFAAVLILYIDLGLKGGLGPNKKFKLPPASTPEGKRARIFGWPVLIALVAAAIIALTSGGAKRSYSIAGILEIVAVILVAMNAYISRKTKN